MKVSMQKGLLLAGLLSTLSLTGCVTQSYENNNQPVIENDATQNEIAMTRISLGLGYLKMGNTTQAKLNLEKAKRFAPNLVQVYTAFAHYYETVSEPEQAQAAYEKALSLQDNDADTLNNYGVFLCRQQKYQQAEQQILKAISMPSYLLVANSYENLALCQLKADDFAKAEHYLSKAIQHSPSSASALIHMTELQYAKADYQQAQHYFARYEKATRRFKADALALAYKIYLKQRKLGVAKNYGAMLVKMFPNDYLAKQYMLNGLRKIAADELAESYQQKQNSVAKSKKRVVVLSPNRSVAKKPAPKQANVNKPLAKQERQVLANSEPVKSKAGKKTTTAAAPTSTTTKIVTNNQVVEDAAASKNASSKATLAKGQTNKSVSEKKNRTLEVNQGQTVVTLPVHVVQKGESLFAISKKYNIRLSSIQRWNKLKRSSVIKIGQVIYLADPRKAVLN